MIQKESQATMLGLRLLLKSSYCWHYFLSILKLRCVPSV